MLLIKEWSPISALHKLMPSGQQPTSNFESLSEAGPQGAEHKKQICREQSTTSKYAVTMR
ncbi:hypothetical protein RchiOBHm_Chr5g0026361 [Rosa chinensis]|uniref:Uncharacterized protein n=1 Tax=Rosa chinensis TaxID=74649 RepID=A0A2P6Q8V8_ROSCH|nr:hypothetical protein RchiOBHm_Chr5g0026361 [Rosa chinensis]